MLSLPWYMTLGGIFGSVIALTFAGLPVFVVFLLINVAGIVFVLGPSAFGMFANSLVATLTSEAFIAVPLFLLMGEMLSRSRAIDELYEAFDSILGQMRIRLYALCTLVATAMGTVSGSAMADAAMLGRSIYPGMVARGYDKKMSTGLILAGSTIAPIIPPSVLTVVLATLANASIAEMLIAGILPGLLLAALYIAYAYIRVLIDPSKAPPLDTTIHRTIGDRIRGLMRMFPFVFVMFAVIGLMLAGIASPTESAAMGVLATVLVSLWLRTFSWRMIWVSMMGAAKISGSVFVIIMSANLFGQLLSFTGATEQMVTIVEGWDVAPWLVFLMLMAITLLAGMFLGATEWMLISVPVFTPIIASVGFDPIWFWTLYLINVVTGGMTPPFGMTMFVFKAAVPGSNIIDIYNSTWPFVAVIFFGILIMAVFPEIVLILPQLMR
ncbi:TRAP transporter large permease [Neorhizobium sp. DT-125]|uniref:TRAP transporter large permease n=1 Tax=Neorhizobium sp. DT-125 TaxID=3396163 RepID=UPI003F1E3B1C